MFGHLHFLHCLVITCLWTTSWPPYSSMHVKPTAPADYPTSQNCCDDSLPPATTSTFSTTAQVIKAPVGIPS